VTSVATTQRRPGAAVALAGAALAVAATAAATYGTNQGRWWEFALLTACASAAAIPEVRVAPGSYISGSFVFAILAAAFVGPVAAVLTPTVACVVAGLVHRARRLAILGNCASVALPNVAAAVLLKAWLPTATSWGTPVAIVAASLVAWVLNVGLVVAFFGLLDGISLQTRLSPLPDTIPGLCLTAVLAGAVGAVYADSPLTGIAFAIALMASLLYMTRQAAISAEQARRLADLAHSRRMLAADAARAEERERRRIAERIHDGALQDLLAARQDLASVASGDASRLPVAARAIDAAAGQLRASVAELHPSATAAAGTTATLRAIAQHAARRAHFAIEVELPEEIRGTDDRLLISVTRELLTNVGRHARARSARLRVAPSNGALLLEVSDDGVGMSEHDRDRALAGGHVGLASIAERVEAIGGDVTITSPADDGCGTRITVAVPTDAAHQAH
jgi:two-component system NarL family sensor kinase